jgi:hypothetical protein
MPGSFHDLSNTPLNNFAVHPCSSDTGRGLPAVGKLVYRTDTPGLYVCTSTTPDATEAGGGTWEPVGRGVWLAYTPTITADTTNPTTNINFTAEGRYSVSGATVEVDMTFDVGFSAQGTGEYRFSIPVNSAVLSVRRYMGSGYVAGINGSVEERFIRVQHYGTGLVKAYYLNGTNNPVALGPGAPFNWTTTTTPTITMKLRYEAV